MALRDRVLATVAEQLGRPSQLDGGQLQLHQAVMDRLPLADASVDAVVSTNTIYFVRDLDAALSAVARVLRPGGRLALGVGDPEAMEKMPFTKHGFRLRPMSEVIDHLSRPAWRLWRIGASETAGKHFT